MRSSRRRPPGAPSRHISTCVDFWSACLHPRSSALLSMMSPGSCLLLGIKCLSWGSCLTSACWWAPSSTSTDLLQQTVAKCHTSYRCFQSQGHWLPVWLEKLHLPHGFCNLCFPGCFAEDDAYLSPVLLTVHTSSSSPARTHQLLVFFAESLSVVISIVFCSVRSGYFRNCIIVDVSLSLTHSLSPIISSRFTPNLQVVARVQRAETYWRTDSPGCWTVVSFNYLIFTRDTELVK